jgi:hypothetical protein
MGFNLAFKGLRQPVYYDVTLRCVPATIVVVEKRWGKMCFDFIYSVCLKHFSFQKELSEI